MSGGPGIAVHYLEVDEPARSGREPAPLAFRAHGDCLHYDGQ